MLVTKEIEIKISHTNKKYYLKKYPEKKIGDTVNISIEELSIGSHKKVLALCDKCNAEKFIPYRDYLASVKNGGYFTCNKCKGDKLIKTNVIKYGVPFATQSNEIKEKIKQTNLEKYGVENVFQSKSIKDGIRTTVKEKYGVPFATQTNEIKEKIKQTNLLKYGYEHHLQNKNILDKQHVTNLERYGSDHYLSSDEYKEKRISKFKKDFNLCILSIEKSYYEILCPKCQTTYTIDINIFLQRLKYKTETCLKCNPINSFSSSGYEIQLRDFIKQHHYGVISFNDRRFTKEIDIYLEDERIGFEFNGVYWHNELKVDDKYHFQKTEHFEKLGIKLIQIYEDDWLYKNEIVKSRILNILGKSEKIYARKCELREIKNNKEIKNFLTQNHIQGYIGSNVKLGLYFENELVSIMIFGQNRRALGQKPSHKSYEMLRFCNKLNTTIVGGASKLFKFFIQNYKPLNVISYADRNWSNGNLYKQLGFIENCKTIPNYYYVVDGIRRHRFLYRKDILVKQGFDTNKTEHEIMLERKIYRIYDSGNLKFIWTS